MRLRARHASRCALLAVAVAAMLGCSQHYVLDHAGIKTPVKVQPPRFPLNAYVQTCSEQECAQMGGILRNSRFFKSVDAMRTAETDIVIKINGTKCDHSEEDPGYAALYKGPWIIATLGTIPPGSHRRKSCRVETSYQFLRPTRKARTVTYPYEAAEYGSGSLPFLWTSEARQEHQSEFLHDQAMSTLLSQIGQELDQTGGL